MQFRLVHNDDKTLSIQRHCAHIINIKKFKLVYLYNVYEFKLTYIHTVRNRFVIRYASLFTVNYCVDDGGDV